MEKQREAQGVKTRFMYALFAHIKEKCMSLSTKQAQLSRQHAFTIILGAGRDLRCPRTWHNLVRALINALINLRGDHLPVITLGLHIGLTSSTWYSAIARPQAATYCSLVPPLQQNNSPAI